jgi:hypothetical protein
MVRAVVSNTVALADRYWSRYPEYATDVLIVATDLRRSSAVPAGVIRRSSLRPLAARRARVSTFAPAGASPMMPPPHSLFVVTGSSSVLPAGMTRITDAEAGVWADAA